MVNLPAVTMVHRIAIFVPINPAPQASLRLTAALTPGTMVAYSKLQVWSGRPLPALDVRVKFSE